LGVVNYGRISFEFRPEMADHFIITNVYEKNGYQYPDDMSGMVVLDVGGNIGASAVLAAERGAKVYAYEPEKSNFELLEKNIERNGFEGRIVAVNEGIGIAGERNLYLHKSNSGCHSAYLMDGQDLDEFIYTKIKVVDLLTVFLRHELKKVDWLKLDCEGSEGDIIDQAIASGVIRNVEKIAIEFHDGLERKYIPILSEWFNVRVLKNAEYQLCKR